MRLCLMKIGAISVMLCRVCSYECLTTHTSSLSFLKQREMGTITFTRGSLMRS